MDLTGSTNNPSFNTICRLQETVPLTNKARATLAGESIQHVHAGASILARLRHTVINQVLTLLPGVAWITAARETIDQVRALPAVLTRITVTLVHVGFARFTYQQHVCLYNGG